MSWKSFEDSERRGDSIYYIVYEPYRSDYSRSLFLELANPSIEDGFRTCVKRGATEIIAIPVFISGRACKKDIPFELEKLTNQFSDVKVTCGNPFGVSETLVKSVYSGSGIEQEDKNEVTLLLVARGSSDPEVLRDINWIASLFQTKEKVKK